MKRGISFSGIKSIIEMFKIFKRENFDLIQYSTPNASLYAAISGKVAGVPVRLYCQWGMDLYWISWSEAKNIRNRRKNLYAHFLHGLNQTVVAT